MLWTKVALALEGLISDSVSYTAHLFHNLAYTKYILLERSIEEYMKRHKSTLTAGCKIFGAKKLKNMQFFSNRALTHTYGPSTF